MRFNYSSTARKSKRSQSALEYMMTYGWAILIIVIVAVILYSMGIFNPSSSVSSTVIGFSGLGSVTAQCTANGVLRISVGDSTGNLINITGITAKDPAITKISNFKPNSTVDPNPLIRSGSSYIFSVPNICPSAGTHYAITVAVNYTEPGQPLPGPYQSLGSITGSVSSNGLLSEVGSFNGVSYINIPSPSDFGTNSMSVSAWVYMKNLSNYRDKISGNNYGGNNDFYLDVLSDDQIEFYLNIGGNWLSIQGGVFPLNKWNFVVGVYNGSFINVYLNGVLEAYTKETGTLSSPPGYLGIGSSPSGSSPYYGYIANEQIYNTYLSNAQIEKMYNAGIDNPLILPANAVDWWPINVTNSTGWTKDFVTDTYNGVLLKGVVLTSNYPTTGLP